MISMRAAGIIVAIAAIGADEPKAPMSEAVREFQGTWGLVSMEIDGAMAPSEAIKDRRLTVEGDDATLRQGETIYSRSRQTLDAKATPRRIDITQVGGAEAGKTTRGIYSLKGDDLTICYVYPGDGRPEEFKAGAGSGCILLKFRRRGR